MSFRLYIDISRLCDFIGEKQDMEHDFKYYFI